MTLIATAVAPSRRHSSAVRDDRRTVDRLAAEFAVLPRWIVESVVRRCRSDLSGVPAGAMPELLERLARQRLLDGTDVAPVT